MGKPFVFALELMVSVMVITCPHAFGLAALVVFGKETHKKTIQNFVWATGYNIVAIPLAAGVLYSAGIFINPALGALLMSLSTIIVAVNVQFLVRKLN